MGTSRVQRGLPSEDFLCGAAAGQPERCLGRDDGGRVALVRRALLHAQPLGLPTTRVCCSARRASACLPRALPTSRDETSAQKLSEGLQVPFLWEIKYGKNQFSWKFCDLARILKIDGSIEIGLELTTAPVISFLL